MKPRRNAIYVLVSSQLDLAYRAVQGGHVALRWAKEHVERRWDEETLVYVDCDDLAGWQWKMDVRGVDYSVFHEPDLDGMLTAIATYGDGRMFSKLNLMS